MTTHRKEHTMSTLLTRALAGVGASVLAWQAIKVTAAWIDRIYIHDVLAQRPDGPTCPAG